MKEKRIALVGAIFTIASILFGCLTVREACLSSPNLFLIFDYGWAFTAFGVTGLVSLRVWRDINNRKPKQ